MSVTEEEAKTKWCPFARVEISSFSAYNNSSYGYASAANRMLKENTTLRNTGCLASACMAWVQTDNKTFPSAPGDPERPSEPAGYCGLAGKP